VSDAITENRVRQRCQDLRLEILGCAEQTLALKKHIQANLASERHEDHGEMLANATIAYRHLEDARMRIGKVLQAQDGGKSVYPA
jgi:hypothetical protein